MAETQRRYERIDVELPCRLFLKDGGDLRFEAFASARNLGLGGLFLACTFSLPKGLELFAELSLPSGPLAIRSRICHSRSPGDSLAGMGLAFLHLDARGREVLLRYFTPPGYRHFYSSMAGEFPHLRKELPLESVSLVVNLWEEWKGRAPRAPLALGSGARPGRGRG